ncbi:heterodisulfide reductase subunit A [Paucidesulfovibrio gracilis DSM 16080]|uniref:Heterodisulfide reductase subunit A n=1 Tax=Paucidesulfovibrio gracilis DSM 16080 TaxID=1121449 RepID=A0A1T4W873_9BACT|nr:FAD-dependent oxidoreductase [Paucidesulfovibrio gracilis]SKA73466.1 heterodisulfide reductase subunit A [Paucidesulfovibrio gracilis DSM 16080]
MRKEYGALVVGAGIAGIRAALDLAVTGHKVALVDRRPHHGGLLTQLDHQFPSDNCGMCKMLPLMARDSSSQYCLRKGLYHDNIDIWLNTELTGLEGDPGQFQASLTRRSSLVDPSKCISCGECAAVCPVRVPNEFNAGLSERGAVYLPVPHAIPNHYVVDLENCARCWKCFEACPTGAIDFKLDQRGEFRVLCVVPDATESQELMGLLDTAGFPAMFAQDQEKALDLLADGEPAGLLLLDMAMGASGVERIVNRAGELRPELPVVLLAGPDEAEAAEELVAQQEEQTGSGAPRGVREWIAKPLQETAFIPWLDKLYVRLASDEHLTFDVGAVVLAGGFDCFDPGPVDDVLGYGRYPGVVTAVEFERMLSSSGPTAGKLTRADGKPVRRIAWIQCVGSRDLQKGANYCSSICCMFSVKEALLAKKQLGDKVEGTIFFMDMRTFGKDFQRYRDRAENEEGVRFIRSRPHSVITDWKGGLNVGWFGDDGRQHEESFDMVVLAVGARPPKGVDKLARAAGVELNEHGFVATRPLAPARTTRHGVFAAGAFAAPRDIAESVIMAGAAAQGAARLIKIHDVLAGMSREEEPEYPDVSREEPRILVAVCSSCPTLEQRLDLEEVFGRLEQLHSVVSVARVGSACTSEGWGEVERLAQEMKPNRILIGACMPYAYVPRLKELGRAVGLNPALMDVVDVYTPTFPGGEELDKEQLERDVYASLATAVARLEGADPVPPPVTVNVAKAALVVGGGVAGMTAATAIADHGYEVCLVEKEEELGGMSMRLYSTLEGADPRKHMEDLITQVEKHPNITVFKDSRVVLSEGTAGRFRTAMYTPKGAIRYEHGVTILASGGKESKVYDYGFKVHKSVMTQLRLEEALATGTLDVSELERVVMIQCWRSRNEERNYCSRVCCSQALKNILALKARNPKLEVVVFYRDIMAYGFKEAFYTEARKAGALFVRYEPERKPQVGFDGGKPVVTGRDPVLGRDVQVRADLLVLSSGVEPEETDELVEIFGVETNQDGFFQEAESKWRPVDFLKQGIYLCGLAHSPMDMGEAVASAQAAAQRALRILSAETIARETVVAQVRHSLCSLCQKCVAACPYGARQVDMEQGRIVVDEILCQGCGSCAAVCPNSATVLSGYHDGPVMALIDAALEEPMPRQTPKEREQ